jgi:radical SAM protein with 4Fe4S-binding SPASM domain
MWQILRKSRPIHLTFFVTRRCNAQCPFCFYLRSEDNKTPARPELSCDEIQKVSSSLGSLLWLAFSGGEIYLREDLAEISRIFYRNNRPAVMLYPTNGLLPGLIRQKTEEILESCKKSIVAVKLTVDGLGDKHDILRATPGSFEKTMETYRLLAPLLERHPHFELGINTVFCSKNQDDMDSIIDFVRGLEHIRTHTISLVRGALRDETFKKVDFKKYRRAIIRLEEGMKSGASPVYRFRGARIKAAQDIMQRRLIHRTLEERRRLIPCYAGDLNLVLTEEGSVYPCEILTESFGNVRDFGYDLRKVVRSAKAQELKAFIKDEGCFCTHECYYMTNILFNPALYPSLLKEYLHVR